MPEDRPEQPQAQPVLPPLHSHVPNLEQFLQELYLFRAQYEASQTVQQVDLQSALDALSNRVSANSALVPPVSVTSNKMSVAIAVETSNRVSANDVLSNQISVLSQQVSALSQKLSGLSVIAGSLYISGGLSVGGNVAVSGTLSAKGVIKGPPGTAGAPTYTFDSDPATGMYLAAAGVLAYAVSGLAQLIVNNPANTFEIRPAAVGGAVTWQFADTTGSVRASYVVDSTPLWDLRLAGTSRLQVASLGGTNGIVALVGTPKADTTRELLRLGNVDLVGGNVAGTWLGSNPAGTVSADFIHFQVSAATVFRVDVSGNISSPTIDTLSNAISVLSQQVSVLSQQVSVHSQQISVLSNQVSVLSQAISVISQQISVLSQGLSIVSNAASNALSVANAASNAASIVSVAAANATSIANAVSAKADTLSNQISVLSQQVSVLSQQVSVLSQSVSVLSQQVSVLSQAVSVLSNTVSAISSRLDTLSNAVSVVSQAVSVISQQVSVISAGLGGMQMKVVTTNQGISSSPLIDISGLSVSVTSAATYQIESRVIYYVSSTPGTIGFGLTFPGMNSAGIRLVWASGLGIVTGGVAEADETASGSIIMSDIPTGGIRLLEIDGLFLTSTVAGTIQVQARAASAASPLNIIKGSFIRAYKVG